MQQSRIVIWEMPSIFAVVLYVMISLIFLEYLRRHNGAIGRSHHGSSSNGIRESRSEFGWSGSQLCPSGML